MKLTGIIDILLFLTCINAHFFNTIAKFSYSWISHVNLCLPEERPAMNQTLENCRRTHFAAVCDKFTSQRQQMKKGEREGEGEIQSIEGKWRGN